MGIFSFIIIKWLFRAKPFESASLDKLAQDMDVTSVLRKSKTSRYFKSKGNRAGCSAFYDGSIVFDKAYYDMLTPDEVLAVVAHEFTHLVKKHVAKKLRRLFLPSLAIGLLAGLLAATNPSWATNVYFLDYEEFIASAIVFPMLFGLLVSSYVIAPWLRQQEIECDLTAVNFGYGEAIINALEKVKIRFPKSKWDAEISKLLPHAYPTIEQRIVTIRKATGSKALEKGN